MTTLLALYRRPDGGADALATFLRRYRGEHLSVERTLFFIRNSSMGLSDSSLWASTNITGLPSLTACAMPGFPPECSTSSSGRERDSERRWSVM